VAKTRWPTSRSFGRFLLVHVKDMNGSGQIVNVGEGRID
jgi:hypothetical protein